MMRALPLLAAAARLPFASTQCAEWSPGGLAAQDWHCVPSSPAANPPDCSDTAGNTITVMADESQRITSSGTLTEWTYAANVAGKTTLQIWRQGPTPTGFLLVCRTEVTAPAAGLQHASLAPGPGDPACQVEEGDYVGMWQPGLGVVGIRWLSAVPDGQKDGKLAVASQAPSITAEPTIGKSFTIQRVGAPRSYAVTLTICGSQWGLMFVAVLAVGVGSGRPSHKSPPLSLQRLAKGHRVRRVGSTWAGEQRTGSG